MYKHILVPTDGSPLAAKGIKEAVKLAQALGAKLTGVYVTAPFVKPTYSEGGGHWATGFSRAQYRQLTQETAHKALRVVETAARAAGVPCSTRVVEDAEPWRGIVKSARAARCQAIVMSSHGRGALGGLILGSETSRVLAHSRLPVLVAR
jgi:nucleotide-binding universal stress UspA family protein